MCFKWRKVFYNPDNILPDWEDDKVQKGNLVEAFNRYGKPEEERKAVYEIIKSSKQNMYEIDLFKEFHFVQSQNNRWHRLMSDKENTS